MTPANSRPVPSYGASELKRLSTNSEVTVRRSEEIDLIAELEELGMQGMAAGRPVVIPQCYQQSLPARTGPPAGQQSQAGSSSASSTGTGSFHSPRSSSSLTDCSRQSLVTALSSSTFPAQPAAGHLVATPGLPPALQYHQPMQYSTGGSNSSTGSQEAAYELQVTGGFGFFREEDYVFLQNKEAAARHPPSPAQQLVIPSLGDENFSDIEEIEEDDDILPAPYRSRQVTTKQPTHNPVVSALMESWEETANSWQLSAASAAAPASKVWGGSPTRTPSRRPTSGLRSTTGMVRGPTRPTSLRGQAHPPVVSCPQRNFFFSVVNVFCGIRVNFLKIMV